MKKFFPLFAVTFMFMNVCVTVRAQQAQNIEIVSDSVKKKAFPTAIVSATVIDTVFLPDSIISSYEILNISDVKNMEELIKLLPGAHLADNGIIIIDGKKVIRIPSDNRKYVTSDTVIGNYPVEIVYSHIIDDEYIPDSLFSQYGVIALPNKLSDVDNLGEFLLKSPGIQKNDNGSLILEGGKEITQEEIELIKKEMKKLPLPD